MSALALRLVDQNRENSDKGSRYDFRHGRFLTKDWICRIEFEEAEQIARGSGYLAERRRSLVIPDSRAVGIGKTDMT